MASHVLSEQKASLTLRPVLKILKLEFPSLDLQPAMNELHLLPSLLSEPAPFGSSLVFLQAVIVSPVKHYEE